MRLPLLLVAAGSVCAACSGQQMSAGGALDRECFDIRLVSNWSALDDRHLYIKGRGADGHFFVTAFHRCPGLRFAETIAFSNRTGQICSDNFGTIMYDDHGSPQRCRIRNVERVLDREEAKALAEARRNAKDEGA